MQYSVKENKCLVETSKIRYGTVLPTDEEGEEGDIFLLLEEEE